ncbi:MAG: hypothetical protein ACLFSV_14300 [Alkalispirochaeta sp.]
MRTSRLIRLLDAELLDAKDDIRDLEEVLRARSEAREITNYVYQENNALLELELHSLERIRSQLGKISPESFGTVDELVAAIKEMVHDQVLHHDVPGAVESIITRRLARITDYLDCGEEQG